MYIRSFKTNLICWSCRLHNHISHIVPLTIWHQRFLEFWLVDTWFFAHPRVQRAVTRLENVHQLNIRRGKKLGFQLSHRQTLHICAQFKNRYIEVVFRSSHRKCSVKTGVLKSFSELTGKHVCHSLYFNKVAGLPPATLLKENLQHRCFPVNFGKFSRAPFL